MNSDIKVVCYIVLALIGIVAFHALVTWLDVFYKREILDVPYCISGGK